MIKKFLFVDFETYYDQVYSLRNLSPPEYILDDRYQTLLMAAYDPKWNAPKIILPDDIPSFLAKYDPEETACCSHNALFDSAILSWRYDWVPARLVDTLGMARALRSYKRNSLGAVAKELFGADTKGDLVYKVKGMDAAAIRAAGLWPDFCTYALNDVRLCFQIYMTLEKEFPREERQVMDLVLRAAVQPRLLADVPLLEQHLTELRRRKARLLQESGYEKAALMSTVQFRKALEKLGVVIQMKTSPTGKWIPQFSKSDPFMADLLEYVDGPDDDVNYQVQTLAAARLSQKSTIEETRAERFLNIATLPWGQNQPTKAPGVLSPSRKSPQSPALREVAESSHEENQQLNGISAPLLPVPLRYGGAHTGRLSGEWSMNMQNLPRNTPGTKSRLRKALVAPPGHTMIAADFAQIEARVVAHLCGEAKLVEQFRRGEDVYASFASVLFHRVITKANIAERFLGKTAILGLGYGCGAARFDVMARTQARQAGIELIGFDEHSAQNTVDTYRALFALIPQSWRRLDHYLANYINGHNPNHSTDWGPVTFKSGKIVLPNRMTLRYQHNDEHLYGAKILENIVQALSRILLMQASVRLAAQGLRFVMQAHDELVFIVPDDDVAEARSLIELEMLRDPEWLPGVPLAVEIGQGANYGECK